MGDLINTRTLGFYFKKKFKKHVIKHKTKKEKSLQI